MKRICIIDGQGGGIGTLIIKKLRALLGERMEIIALGTNAIATAQMLKARANRGASGENAIVQTAPTADVIIGPVAILVAHAMLGEVTPKMAAAIAAATAPKLLIPLNQENINIAGVAQMPLPELVDELIEKHFKPLID